MAKQKKNNSSSSSKMAKPSKNMWMGLLALALAGGGYWCWNSLGEAKESVEVFFQSGNFLTLEARYTPEQIMEAHREALLKTTDHAFQRPELRFYPFALFDVKYSREDKKTQEGTILWNLSDGEMVVDTEGWHSSHGFSDCIDAAADDNDFRVINALSQKNRPLSKEELQKCLQVEEATIGRWLQNLMDKRLIVQHGSDFRLHIENPAIPQKPVTTVRDELVAKPYKHTMRMPGRYSIGQVKRNACSAFGNHFAIRNQKEIYLPIYSISVKNPDGTVATTYWNAMSGQQIKLPI